MNTIAKIGVRELDGIVPKARACALFDLPRSSLYYQSIPKEQQKPRGGGVQPNAITDAEKTVILKYLHSERLCDKSPRLAHTQLLDDGRYLGSPRTFARILADNGESVDRSLQHHKQPRPRPRLVASSCNAVWSWDTSPLRSTQRSVFFHLYVILDLYSRYAVKWHVDDAESSDVAETLFREAAALYNVDTSALGVHGDNGPIQRSDAIRDCFVELGITKTHSRPYVSNDNAYSESLFKTAKYHPVYPWCFSTLQEARAWANEFFTYYNTDHYHSGIAMLTPASVYFGTADEIIQQRQVTLDDAFAAHPERFRNGQPVAKRPEPAWINKPSDDDVREGAGRATKLN